jgi:hypothetical protein
MQTFLPYADFDRTAACLDYRRLGKQRVEAKQILNALQGKSTGWTNHPATNMWRGYEDALSLYHNRIIIEWIDRGYNNNMPYIDVGKVVMPPWMGDENFHSSHRAALLFKQPDHYSQFNWNETPSMMYVWPTGEA